MSVAGDSPEEPAPKVRRMSSFARDVLENPPINLCDSHEQDGGSFDGGSFESGSFGGGLATDSFLDEAGRGDTFPNLPVRKDNDAVATEIKVDNGVVVPLGDKVERVTCCFVKSLGGIVLAELPPAEMIEFPMTNKHGKRSHPTDVEVYNGVFQKVVVSNDGEPDIKLRKLTFSYWASRNEVMNSVIDTKAEDFDIAQEFFDGVDQYLAAGGSASRIGIRGSSSGCSS